MKRSILVLAVPTEEEPLLVTHHEGRRDFFLFVVDLPGSDFGC